MGVHQDSETYKKVKELLGIPEDEPIFILRAQDRYAPNAIMAYRSSVDNDAATTGYMRTWWDQVGSIISDFRNWQRDNRDKVKRPD